MERKLGLILVLVFGAALGWVSGVTVQLAWMFSMAAFLPALLLFMLGAPGSQAVPRPEASPHSPRQRGVAAGTRRNWRGT